MKWWGGIAVSVALTFVGLPVQAAAITDHVVINEIMANPATGEVEWIELYNPTDTTVAMAGWRLVVTSGNFSGVFASDVTIQPHGYVVRSASDATSKLNNTSATIVLKPSASSAAIDTVTYGGIAQTKTYARECDASDVWLAQAAPTQGAANCSVVPPPLPPKDTMSPVIDNVVSTVVSGQVRLSIAATDETSVPTLTALAVQYGAEIATAAGSGQVTIVFDSTTYPNGVVLLIITATDAAGNSTTKTVELTIANVVATTPAPTAPVAVPVVAKPIKTTVASLSPSTPVAPGVGAVVPISTTKPVAPMATIAVTASAAKVVAAPAIVRTTAAPSVAAPTQKLSSSDTQPIITSTLGGISSGGGESLAQKSVVVAASQTIPTVFIATGLAVLITSYGIWRYLRRTKP